MNNYRDPHLAHRYFAIKMGVPTILVETQRAGSVALERRTLIHYEAFTATARYAAGEPLTTPTRVIAAWLEGANKGSAVAKSGAGSAQTAQQARPHTELAGRGGDRNDRQKRAELQKAPAKKPANRHRSD